MRDQPICYEFPPFRMDVQGTRLFFKDEYIALTNKAARLLIFLLQNSTKVVLKAELMEAMWPGTYVEEANLTNLVSELRKALKAKQPDVIFIKTYPKRGYSFEVSPVECKGDHRGQLFEQFVTQHGHYNDFFDTFKELIGRARHVTLFVVHSQRWRNNHIEELIQFLNRDGTSLSVYLPRLTNNELLDQLANDFNEGSSIYSLVREAYKAYSELMKNHSGKVLIRPVDFYPTYTFYRFDSDLIVAMHPITKGKRTAPAFHIQEGSRYWAFFLRDFDALCSIKSLSEKGLQRLLG